MYSAAELIEAVQRKLRLAQRRSHPPGEFPAGWRRWLDEMAARPGDVQGAPAQALVDELLSRPPRRPLPGRSTDLTRWQAFTAVLRQEWSDEPRDDRGLRGLAAGGSFLLNLVFALSLLYLLFAPPRLPPAREGEESVVQVEFIGRGTPSEPGGGPDAQPRPDAQPTVPDAAAPSPVPDAAMPPAPDSATETATVPPPMPALPEVPVATAQLPALPPPPLQVDERDVPTPEPPQPAPTPQPVTVSEPAPDTGMVFLPPPNPVLETATAAPELTADAPAVQRRDVPVVPEAPPQQRSLEFTPRDSANAPDLAVRPSEVERRDVAAPVRRPSLDMPVPTPADVPPLAPSTATVPERSVPVPVSRPSLQMRETPSAAAPSLSDRSDTTSVRERAVPTPSASNADPATPATDTLAGRQDPSEGRAAASSADGVPSARATTGGPAAAPAAGGWPDPRQADDFGASDREVEGGQRGRTDATGLYNPDGSIRLPDAPGSASPGLPPGTYTEEIADLDRAGTWLKRPPVGYEPTLFDRYWRPNETLLQEWVRRGIQEVSIPIPGTTKSIRCAVSLLALGGGCGISDPNLNEQPAIARPPPDIPFKPELQDDNGSLPEPVNDTWD